jgi:hypothetical protein
LAAECGSIMFKNVASILTLTWYHGDLQKAQGPLRERVSAILRANPWLLSSFEKTADKGASLVYSESINLDEQWRTMDVIFTVESDPSDALPPLTRTTPYEQLATILKPYLVEATRQRPAETSVQHTLLSSLFDTRQHRERE